MLKNFFSLNQRSLFLIHDPVGVKLLTRLRLQFSHLNKYKFRHNFKDCVSPMCDCGAETETTSHFFLGCPIIYGLDRFNDSKIRLHTVYCIQGTKRFERPLIDQC